MISKRSSRPCLCSRTFPFSTPLLFLSAILPSYSFAQPSSTPPNTSTQQDTPLPTTLQTSISQSATSATPSFSQPQPTNPLPSSYNDPASTTSNDPATTTEISDTDYNPHIFNYYFLIIAVIAIVVCILILYVGRRRKRKIAVRRSTSQRALARDVEGFRARFGMGWPTAGGGGGGRVGGGDIPEGLDERGEAPPPYVPGSKPPSIRAVEREGRGDSRPSTGASGERFGETDSVELQDMRADVPPSYDEHRGTGHTGSESADGGIARPDTALTAERMGSTRRLLSTAGSSTMG